MAELRHSASMISSAKLLFSPSSPPCSASPSASADDSDLKKDLHRSSLRSLLLLSDHRNFLIGSLALLLFLAVVFLPSLWSRLSAPYLCYKEGITLHCPRVKEAPSLWENPHASTTSWKSCAERRGDGVSDLPPENETTGYIFIHAEDGLNQQRIAICNAVAVAKIMNATLILPVLKQDQIWKDKTNFEDIFDVDHFIEYLKDDVRIVESFRTGYRQN